MSQEKDTGRKVVVCTKHNIACDHMYDGFNNPSKWWCKVCHVSEYLNSKMRVVKKVWYDKRGNVEYRDE